ncbi:MAG: O-antigen ligase family protein [Pseudomonadota bacterium]
MADSSELNSVSNAQRSSRPLVISVRRTGDLAFGITVFLAAFVFFEPAPYELLLAFLMVVWFAFGLSLHRGFLPLTFLMACYILGGMIGATQRVDITGGFIYIATTAFLAVSAIFYAALIAERPVERMAIVSRAYVFAAVISALVGIAAYFRLFPGAEGFLFAGRAKGTFEDPNVYSPYLALAFVLLLRQVLTQPLTRSLLSAMALAIIVIAIFLAFSRAAWGLTLLSAGLLTVILYATAPSSAARVRLLLATVAFAAMAVAALLFILSFDAVSSLFAERARLVQSYDGARFGRFARYTYGLHWIMEAPLGYGFGKFRETFGEDSHNVYLKAFTVHGWLGGLAYLIFIATTLITGFKHMFRASPLQPYFQAVYIVILGHAIVGLVIDTDRWRHLYLLFGILWGMMAAENAGRSRIASSRARPQ